ncbi:hypothetical protein L0938_18280 [Paracidovorax citrulli]
MWPFEGAIPKAHQRHVGVSMHLDALWSCEGRNGGRSLDRLGSLDIGRAHVDVPQAEFGPPFSLTLLAMPSRDRSARFRSGRVADLDAR